MREPARAHAERVRRAAAGHGRDPRFGIRLHVVTRDTSAQAWAAADALLADADDDIIAAAQATLADEQSVGQQRMVALHGGRRDQLEIYPNPWAGPGLLRGGAGTAPVGSHAEVADRIAEYRSAGYDEFVLSGWPHDEEAGHFGRGVLPELCAAPRPGPRTSTIRPRTTGVRFGRCPCGSRPGQLGAVSSAGGSPCPPRCARPRG